MELSGVIPPAVTVFTPDEKIDEDGMRAEIKHLLDAGVHGLTLTGSTGEGDSLTIDECCNLAALAHQETGGRVPLIMGVIQDSTRAVIEKAKALQNTGIVDALQITPVHYLHPPSEPGTIDYYQEIGDAVGLPIVIYNVIPWNSLSVRTLTKLANQPMIVAVKQSGGDIHKLADLLQWVHATGSPLKVISGIDALLFPSYMLGAHGSVAALLAVLPRQSVALWDAVHAGDLTLARKIHESLLPVRRAIEGSQFDKTSYVKAAIEVQGRSVGNPLRPQVPVTPEAREELREAIVQSGELG